MVRKKLADIQPIELTVENDKPMASSLQVAKHFGKAHNDVLKAIRNIEQDVPASWFAGNFAPTEIPVKVPASGGIRNDPIYMMTRDGFAFMAMGFTGKRAVQWKIGYLNAFNSLEESLIRTQGKPAPLELPEGNYPSPLERKLIIIEKLIKLWAFCDNISIKVATTAVCASLRILDFNEFKDDHFGLAVDFIFRTFFTLKPNMDSSSKLLELDAQAEEQFLQIIEEIFYTMIQFDKFRVGIDMQKILRDLGVFTTSTFLQIDLSKLALITWGVFQFWYGYTLSALKSKEVE